MPKRCRTGLGSWVAMSCVLAGWAATAAADPPSGYYDSVATSTPALLRATLHAVIDDHMRFPFTSGSTDTWDILELADEDPNNAANILDVYQNASFVKFGGGVGPYNREHVWPNSYGFPDDNSGNYPYSDCHMLFLCDVGYNGDRGNNAFRTCSAGCNEAPTAANNGQGGGSGTYPGNSNWYTGVGASGTWETWIGRRGDVARAMLYADVRYEGGNHGISGAAEPELILTDETALISASATGSNEAVAYMGARTVLLEWHVQDPVDDVERDRNDIVFNFQGNRNPFVDHPEWVSLLFGGGTVCDGPADCDDGVACTADDCADGFCVFAPLDAACDDGIDCTDDVCDAIEGCQALPVSAACDDGIDCTVNICSPISGCLFAPQDAACEDGLDCTDDICDPGGGCQHAVAEACQGITLAVVEKALSCDAPGLRLCNVGVHFDDPADTLLSIGFVDITTDDPQGFYQFPAAMGGASTAPQDVLLGLFPGLACDSFVTIGLKSVPVGGSDCSTLDPDFDTTLFNSGGGVTGGWFCNNPPSGQGLPDAEGNVLVAQLGVADGFQVTGTVSIFFNDGMLQLPAAFECFDLCPPDLNGSGAVDAADLALLLGAWGPNPGHPADLNSDGAVNAADLALLLGAWGPC